MKIILTKKEIAEGITQALIKSINIKRQASPVILELGDEPVKLMACDKGFWVLGENKKPILNVLGNDYFKIPDRTAIIGRARYLLSFSSIEKKEKAATLVQKWRDTCFLKIENISSQIDEWKETVNEESFSSAISKQALSPVKFSNMIKDAKDNLEKFIPVHEELLQMYTENKFVELITILKIHKIKDPMLIVNYDSSQDMKTLINVFNSESLKKWDRDMLFKYAEIEIEKQYVL